MFLILIGATLIVILTGLFSWPNERYHNNWTRMWGWLAVWTVVIGMIVMVTGGILWSTETGYTTETRELALESTGGSSYVLALSDNDQKMYVWKTSEGPVSTYTDNAEIIPFEEPKVAVTEWDTTKWALWPKSPSFVLYVPSGGLDD